MLERQYAKQLNRQLNNSQVNVKILFIDRKSEPTDGDEYAYAVITSDADEVTNHLKDTGETKQLDEHDDMYHALTSFILFHS